MHSTPGALPSGATSPAEAKRVKTEDNLAQTSVSSSTVPTSNTANYKTETSVPAVVCYLMHTFLLYRSPSRQPVALSSAALGPLSWPPSHQSNPSHHQPSSTSKPTTVAKSEDSQTSVTSDRPPERDVSEKFKEVKELEDQLVTIRKLLNENWKQEEKLCQQLQQTDPECHVTQIRRKGYSTSVHGRSRST